MRLIDKTKLVQQLSVFEKRHKYIKEVSTIIDIIALTHEEDAIPIEWIVMWLEKNKKRYCTVGVMLEDWRKENEGKL